MLPFLNSLNSPLTSLWKILVAPNSLHLPRVVSGKHVKQEVVGKTLTQEQLSEFKPQILNFLSSPLGYSFRLPHSLWSRSFRGLQLSSLRHLHLARCSFQILTPVRERSKRSKRDLSLYHYPKWPLRAQHFSPLFFASHLSELSQKTLYIYLYFSFYIFPH